MGRGFLLKGMSQMQRLPIRLLYLGGGSFGTPLSLRKISSSFLN